MPGGWRVGGVRGVQCHLFPKQWVGELHRDILDIMTLKDCDGGNGTTQQFYVFIHAKSLIRHFREPNKEPLEPKKRRTVPVFIMFCLVFWNFLLFFTRCLRFLVIAADWLRGTAQWRTKHGEKERNSR